MWAARNEKFIKNDEKWLNIKKLLSLHKSPVSPGAFNYFHVYPMI